MLCWNAVNSAPAERERLLALLAAVEDPARAAALDPGDPLLLTVARHHRLTPLLSVVCAGGRVPALAAPLRRDRAVTAARGLLLGQVAEQCLRGFAAAGIPAIVLKGLDYEARLYAAAPARPTSDVDLLVPNSARRDAFAVLDRLGFEPRAAAPGFDDADYHEVAWQRGPIEIDLHLALAPFARCRIDYDAIWNEAQRVRIGQTDALGLAPIHAAIFHALHMAIDHFDVPALYLVDMSRLLPDPDRRRAADETARAWRCRRPLLTATSLTAAFLPEWARGQPAGEPGPLTRRVIAGYGPVAALPRREQLLRKLAHFDVLSDALRYLAVQSRRNVREELERRIFKRSPRERLELSSKRLALPSERRD